MCKKPPNNVTLNVAGPSPTDEATVPNQWFSAGCNSVPQETPCSVWRELGCPNGEGGCFWHLVGRRLLTLQCTGQTPTTKDYPAQCQQWWGWESLFQSKQPFWLLTILQFWHWSFQTGYKLPLYYEHFLWLLSLLLVIHTCPILIICSTQTYSKNIKINQTIHELKSFQN